MEIQPFLDRLASAVPDAEENPTWLAFRRQAEARYLAGVDTFVGERSFRRRNNPAEALEEAVDLGNYMGFALLVDGDEDADVALMAAFHAYRAYHFICRYVAKQSGAP